MFKSPGFHKKRKGAALVEFAIILPLLLIIIAGVLELSLFLIQDNTLNKAVRESSLYLARNLGFEGCYTNIATDVIGKNMTDMFGSSYADFTSSNGSIAMDQLCVNETSGNIESTTLFCSVPGTCPAFCSTPGPACAANSHLHIRVSATYNAVMVMPGLMGFNFTPTLSATSIMRVQ